MLTNIRYRIRLIVKRPGISRWDLGEEVTFKCNKERRASGRVTRKQINRRIKGDKQEHSERNGRRKGLV